MKGEDGGNMAQGRTEEVSGGAREEERIEGEGRGGKNTAGTGREKVNGEGEGADWGGRMGALWC